MAGEIGAHRPLRFEFEVVPRNLFRGRITVFNRVTCVFWSR